MSAPLKVLFIDIEGGFGGSSRSLFELASRLDRAQAAPEIWYRSQGPGAERLAAHGIAARHEPMIASWVPRERRNARAFAAKAPGLAKLKALAARIAAHDHDVLHLNYDGLFLLARRLRALGDRRPIVLHARTMVPLHPLSRWMIGVVARSVDHVIFISENERDRYAALGFPAAKAASSVLYNFAEVAPRAPADGPFRALFMGGLDEERAPDRMIELAAVLKAHGLPVTIDIFGRNPRYSKFFLFARRNSERLQARAAKLDVTGVVRFRGPTRTPDAEMAASHVLIRPSRRDDPWGRDIIEAMCMGLPVIATGRYGGFVEDGRTGFLLGAWDAARCAELLARLHGDAALQADMRAGALERARRLFDPARYMAEIHALYRDLAARAA